MLLRTAEHSLSFWLSGLLVAGGVLLSGCGATAPVVDSIETPDTLRVGQSGTFQAVLGNEQQADRPLTHTWRYGDGSSGSGLQAEHT